MLLKLEIKINILRTFTGDDFKILIENALSHRYLGKNQPVLGLRDARNGILTNDTCLNSSNKP